MVNGYLLLTAARVAASSGDHAQAIALCTEALQANNLDPAEQLEAGLFNKAIETAGQASEIIKNLESAVNEGWALMVRAGACYMLGDDAETLLAIQTALTVFQQTDSTTIRKYDGTSLGLSISKQLTQLLDCDLTASSTEGQGFTFTLTIPIRYNVKGQELQLVTCIL